MTCDGGRPRRDGKFGVPSGTLPPTARSAGWWQVQQEDLTKDSFIEVSTRCSLHYISRGTRFVADEILHDAPDNNWVVTGPHVMIVGAEARSMLEGYPREATADPSKPYVMWPGTPYEHLMLPVE